MTLYIHKYSTATYYVIENNIRSEYKMICKDRVVPGLISGEDICKLREDVCISVEKVYDHCREKDCIEDAVVEFHKNVNDLINNAFKVRTKEVEVEEVFADIEEVPFKNGFYTVNIKYKIRVSVEFCVKSRCGIESEVVDGYVYFSKTVMLFGSEGNIKIFKSPVNCNNTESDFCSCSALKEQDNLPATKVEVAEPIALNTRIKRIHHCKPNVCEAVEAESEGLDNNDAPESTGGLFPTRRVVVTIGIFSIIKLTRKVQLLIPAFDFCYPNKECVASTDEDPCEVFDAIDFPVDQFFPPQIFDFPGALEAVEDNNCHQK